MVMAKNEYQPDYAVPPGWVLEERLAAEGLSQAAFARQCGRSPKLISEIIAGKAPIEPNTAVQFERVLDVGASVWLGMESAYRLHLARQDEAAEAAASVAWSKAFPIRELQKRGHIRRSNSSVEPVSSLLAFFRVGSIDAWEQRYSLQNVAYRHSPSFESSRPALATWLRLGEIAAEREDCAAFSQKRFRQAVREIREVTRQPIGEGLERAGMLCRDAGVAFVLVKPLPGTSLSGAARWITPRRAVIQLSARHKTNDHLWFSFFHEAAHILLHSKKDIFVEQHTETDDEREDEANEWASNTLIPRDAWQRFRSSGSCSRGAVEALAAEQGIAPGIVVGRLQHEGALSWNRLNDLKVRLIWKAEAEGDME